MHVISHMQKNTIARPGLAILRCLNCVVSDMLFYGCDHTKHWITIPVRGTADVRADVSETMNTPLHV